MSAILKVLTVPHNSVGSVNACLGLTRILANRGHSVVFAVQHKSKDSIEPNYPVIVLNTEDIDNVKNSEDKFLYECSPLEQAMTKAKTLSARIDYYIKLNEELRQVLDSTRPDVILIDHMFAIPCVEMSGIPWVLVWSGGPLYLYGNDENVPPFESGLSTYGDKSQWKKYRDNIKHITMDQWRRFDEYVVSRGCRPLKKYQFINGSPHLNIYGFPSELDYNYLKPLPDHYLCIDYLTTIDNRIKFEIPEKLRDRPGKLIYLSMGSSGGMDVKLMKRLIDFLGDSKHRFIVSKGSLHDRYELADNMWGQKTVPQTQVLPVIDLVITNGGNNTVCETFFFGKPMIVMPLFGDQYDSAQRVHEKGYGMRVNPYNCTKLELFEVIERILNDEELNESIKVISRRIQYFKFYDIKFGERIENLIQNK